MATLSQTLVEGRFEVNARWPSRSKASDGWIGNQAHAAVGWPTTKHQPNPRGYVHAIDLTFPGIDPYLVIACFQRHPRSYLWIFDGEIALKREGWRRRRYTGPSMHREHIHVEDDSTAAAESDHRGWGLTAALHDGPVLEPAGGRMERMPTLRLGGGVRASVRILQRTLISIMVPIGASGADGRFGPATRAAVAAFQRAHRLDVDGTVGPRTWTALMQALLGGGIPVDGKAGPLTQARIRARQSELGVTADGIWGPRSWAAALG